MNKEKHTNCKVHKETELHTNHFTTKRGPIMPTIRLRMTSFKTYYLNKKQ